MARAAATAAAASAVSLNSAATLTEAAAATDSAGQFDLLSVALLAPAVLPSGTRGDTAVPGPSADSGPGGLPGSLGVAAATHTRCVSVGKRVIAGPGSDGDAFGASVSSGSSSATPDDSSLERWSLFVSLLVTLAHRAPRDE